MNFSINELKENFINARATEKSKREEKAIRLLEKMYVTDCSVLAEILECPDNYEDVYITTIYRNKMDEESMVIQLKTPFNVIVRTIFNRWFKFKNNDNMNITYSPVITKSFYMDNAFLVIPKQTESYDNVMNYFLDKLKNNPMLLVCNLSLQGARF